MKFVVAFVIGLGLIAVLHLGPMPMVALGLVSGCVAYVADVFYPAARETYVAPANRPRPVTAKGQLIITSLCFVLGIFVIALALLIRLPLASASPTFAYGGGMLAGLAIAMLMTSAKVREDRNGWLASMSPKESLDLNHE